MKGRCKSGWLPKSDKNDCCSGTREEFCWKCHPPRTLPPNLSFMKIPFFISSLAGRCLAWAPIGGQIHPNCHSQPPLCHSLIDSCQSPLIGVKHALKATFPPVLGLPGGVRTGILQVRVTTPHLAVPSTGDVRWAKGQCQGNGPQELWLCQDEPRSLGKSHSPWPEQQLPAWHSPWLWSVQEGGCSLSALPLLKGHEEERLCHQSCELDLSGLAPYLFRNCGRFPASCFPGATFSSQPFVPRHRPGLGTSAPAPFRLGQHRALFREQGRGNT